MALRRQQEGYVVGTNQVGAEAGRSITVSPGTREGESAGRQLHLPQYALYARVRRE